MDFKAFARAVLEEFEGEVNERASQCPCNMRESPCSWCWEAGVLIGRLEDALTKEP